MWIVGTLKQQRSGVLAVAAFALFICMRPAIAANHLDPERSISQIVVIDNQARSTAPNRISGKPHTGKARPGVAEPARQLSTSSHLAILPQLGYTPDAGFILGVKLSDINVGPSHMNLDIGATQSTAGRSDFKLSWTDPHLFDTGLIGSLQLQYQLTPRRNFYGLGNNDVGDHALTTHENHATSILLTLAQRVMPHLVAAATIGYDRITIGPGKPGHKPTTTSTFSNLPGIRGGNNNPVSLSLIYNTRHDLTRPTRGWNVIGKVSHVGSELGNPFHYTRYIVDGSYITPVLSPDHLFGVRVDGAYVDGSGQNLPFYAFPTLGGADSLAGFYPYRFRGQSRLFARAGYQTLLADFNFYDIWRVRLDGSLFAGVGRVFLDRSKLPDALLRSTPDVAPDLSDRLQYSYGTGLHIALGEALTARLDAGFSRESQGLVYLSFGNAF